MVFICYHCNASFTSKYNLLRHITAKHSNNGAEEENLKNRQKGRILCCVCNSNFNTFTNYHRHLRIVHNVAVITNTSTFSTIQEFRNWKMNFEKETSSMFVQTTSAKKLRNQSITYYFYCHRSFLGKKHKRKTINREKHAGSNKIGESCPAMMKAVVTNDTVTVDLCSTHLGHDCDVGRLRLSIEEKNSIAEKLNAGVPPRRILADIKQENTPPANLDRIHLTKMSDLYNIKKSYKITCPLRSVDNDHSNSSMVQEIEVDEQQIGDDLESQELNEEKSRILAKISAISDALHNAALTREQQSEILKHLDIISAEIHTSSSSSKDADASRMAPNNEVIKQTFFSTRQEENGNFFIPPSSHNTKIVIQGLLTDQDGVPILTQNLGEHIYTFYEQ